MKEVKIKIESTVEELDDAGLTESSEKTETSAKGFIDGNEDKIKITYSETEENVTTGTLITVTSSEVSVRREGGVEYEFVFREGESTSSIYSVPPYSFDTEIYTRKIRNTLKDTAGEISLLYDMTIGGAKKRTRMKIKVMQK